MRNRAGLPPAGASPQQVALRTKPGHRLLAPGGPRSPLYGAASAKMAAPARDSRGAAIAAAGPAEAALGWVGRPASRPLRPGSDKAEAAGRRMSARAAEEAGRAPGTSASEPRSSAAVSARAGPGGRRRSKCGSVLSVETVGLATAADAEGLRGGDQHVEGPAVTGMSASVWSLSATV